MIEPETDTGILVKLLLIIGILRGVCRIVIDTPKVWETLREGWHAFERFIEGLETRIKQILAYTATSPPVDTPITPGCGAMHFNVVDAVNMGLNSDYTKLRFRQNVSVYYQNRTDPSSGVFELA